MGFDLTITLITRGVCRHGFFYRSTLLALFLADAMVLTELLRWLTKPDHLYFLLSKDMVGK